MRPDGRVARALPASLDFRSEITLFNVKIAGHFRQGSFFSLPAYRRFWQKNRIQRNSHGDSPIDEYNDNGQGHRVVVTPGAWP